MAFPACTPALTKSRKQHCSLGEGGEAGSQGTSKLGSEWSRTHPREEGGLRELVPVMSQSSKTLARAPESHQVSLAIYTLKDKTKYFKESAIEH